MSVTRPGLILKGWLMLGTGLFPFMCVHWVFMLGQGSPHLLLKHSNASVSSPGFRIEGVLHVTMVLGEGLGQPTVHLTLAKKESNQCLFLF